MDLDFFISLLDNAKVKMLNVKNESDAVCFRNARMKMNLLKWLISRPNVRLQFNFLFYLVHRFVRFVHVFALLPAGSSRFANICTLFARTSVHFMRCAELFSFILRFFFFTFFVFSKWLNWKEACETPCKRLLYAYIYMNSATVETCVNGEDKRDGRNACKQIKKNWNEKEKRAEHVKIKLTLMAN